MKKIKKSILALLRKSALGRLIVNSILLRMFYLRDSGWVNSVKKGLPVDSIDNELPWFTYGAIHFLKERLNDNFVVFEFGSGNSTLWFSKKVNEVISVEHDQSWYDRNKSSFEEISNIEYIHREEKTGDYSNEILKYSNQIDVLIIDGVDRVQCCLKSLSSLKPSGVILWDNSDRTSYQEGYDFLISNGFKRLDFAGHGPLNFYTWCTSIFYRKDNCLGI